MDFDQFMPIRRNELPIYSPYKKLIALEGLINLFFSG
jgi:hypothetical protein